MADLHKILKDRDNFANKDQDSQCYGISSSNIQL